MIFEEVRRASVSWDRFLVCISSLLWLFLLFGSHLSCQGMWIGFSPFLSTKSLHWMEKERNELPTPTKTFLAIVVKIQATFPVKNVKKSQILELFLSIPASSNTTTITLSSTNSKHTKFNFFSHHQTMLQILPERACSW